jgi:transposase-like protein
LAQLEDLHLPELLRLITDKYTSQHAQAYVCETCNQSFNTKRSLAAHRKVHVKK